MNCEATVSNQQFQTFEHEHYSFQNFIPIWYRNVKNRLVLSDWSKSYSNCGTLKLSFEITSIMSQFKLVSDEFFITNRFIVVDHYIKSPNIFQ